MSNPKKKKTYSGEETFNNDLLKDILGPDHFVTRIMKRAEDGIDDIDPDILEIVDEYKHDYCLSEPASEPKTREDDRDPELYGEAVDIMRTESDSEFTEGDEPGEESF